MDIQIKQRNGEISGGEDERDEDKDIRDMIEESRYSWKKLVVGEFRGYKEKTRIKAKEERKWKVEKKKLKNCLNSLEKNGKRMGRKE